MSNTSKSHRRSICVSEGRLLSRQQGRPCTRAGPLPRGLGVTADRKGKGGDAGRGTLDADSYVCVHECMSRIGFVYVIRGMMAGYKCANSYNVL